MINQIEKRLAELVSNIEKYVSHLNMLQGAKRELEWMKSEFSSSNLAEVKEEQKEQTEQTEVVEVNPS